MRNLKRFLALVMAALMLCGMTVLSTSAADDAGSDDYLEAAQQLAALTIMKGDENGNLNLSNGVTRYQAALFFVQALTGKTEVSVWNSEKKSTVFGDVPEYGTAIDYAYSTGLILGRGDGTYGYNDPIMYQDMLVMAVRALGYETAAMAYPNGYVLAAQMLSLTDKISNTDLRAELTRGETAQIIWNMLNTQVAFIDPMSNTPIYPGQEASSTYGMIVGADKIERTMLLQKAGYANGKLEAVILAFDEAEDADDVDTVEIEYTYQKNGSAIAADLEVAAADLGIAADTPKIGYLGLPMTLYVNCAAEDFASYYSMDPRDRKASIVFTSRETLNSAENLGDAGTIRYIDDNAGVVQISDTKYALDKYDLLVYMFDTADGWTENAAAKRDFCDNFRYKTKGGYEDALNSYGSVLYTVRGESENQALHIYYTPYTFGQYFVRSLQDASTRKAADFVTIGSYRDTPKTNYDGVSSHFVEVLLGTGISVTGPAMSVSVRNGEKAKTVTIEGQTVHSGDFMFYAYNSADNILTVAMNCGGFKIGRLTGTGGTGSSSYTLKINNANKRIGFKGAYDSDIPSYYDQDLIDDIIDALKAGENNVRYIEADGQVVYYEQYSKDADVSAYDYAIVSIDEERLADLLDMTATQFERALTAGLYLDSDGNVAIAVFNTETGKWELASLRYMEAGAYDGHEDEFEVEGQLSQLAEYYDMMGSKYARKDDYELLYDALSSASVFVVRNEKNGVYDLAEWNPDDELLTYGTGEDGILFTSSSSASRTNAISANDSKTAARVMLDSKTIIVVASGSHVGVRVGKQTDAHNVEYAGKFLSANAGLIVFVTDRISFNAETWGQATASGGDETWYVATAKTNVETEAVGDDSYTVTVTNLIDLRTLKTVKQISYTVDSFRDAPTEILAGEVLYMNRYGDCEPYDSLEDAFVDAVQANGDDNRQDFIEVNVDQVEFIDEVSIRIDELKLNGVSAIEEIKATILTLDLTDYDTKTYDYGSMALDIPYEDSDLGAEHLFGDKYAYVLDGDLVEKINEPTPGILDQLVIASNGEIVLIPKAGAKNFTDAAEATMRITMLAYEENDVVTLYVLKVLSPAD